MAPQTPETSEPPQDRARPSLVPRRGRAVSSGPRRPAARGAEQWAGRRAGLAARQWARQWVRQWVRTSPGTHVWLAVLAVTSVIVAVSSPSVRSYVLHGVSTNLVELRHHPVRVLVASALWIQAPSAFVFYAVLFELVHTTAERWLGTWRWLLVAAVAHVGATLVSQKAVRLGIRDQRLPRSLAHTVDIGVSYGLAGVVGVLTYRVPRPWRWGYAAVVLAFFGFQVAHEGTFTDLGHLTAVLIGLGCYVLTPPDRARKGGGAAGGEDGRSVKAAGESRRPGEGEGGRRRRPVRRVRAVFRRGRRGVPESPRCRPRRWTR